MTWQDERFRDKISAALIAAEPGYGERNQLEGGKPASVLVLFGTSREAPQSPSLLITKRTDSVGSHKGQMAFPGGMSEEFEIALGETGFVSTALRETHEEIGIEPACVTPIGKLPELTTITGFRVTPIVGLLNEPIEQVPLQLNEHEIAAAFWIPLSVLLQEGIYRTEYIRVGAVNYPVHTYQVGEHRIWGATGSMIKNLLDRLQSLS